MIIHASSSLPCELPVFECVYLSSPSQVLAHFTNFIANHIYK
jgi:hypothetical protein